MSADVPSEQDRLALDFITRYIRQHGRPPTTREVGKSLGLPHPNNASRVVARLVAGGRLAQDGGTSRGLRLVAPPPESAIPLRGRVSCGPPREAEDAEEWLDLAGLFPGGDVAAFEAVGESMIEAHIRPGDYVVVRERPPESGETVVAMLGREMVCKVYRRGRGRRVRLEPCNGAMEPIVVDDPERTHFRVLGVLAGVIRRV